MTESAVERLRLPATAGAAGEASVRAHLEALGVRAHAWSNGPGDRYAAHAHDYAKVLMCAAGSITFVLDDERLVLAPGDGFVLPAGTRHAAVVGPRGVTCLEGQRR